MIRPEVPVLVGSALILAVMVGAGSVRPLGDGFGGVAAGAEPAVEGAVASGEKPWGLAPAWSFAGPCSGLATARDGRSVVVNGHSTRCRQVDAAGATLRGFPFVHQSGRIRAARLFDGTEGLVGFSRFPGGFFAIRGDGEKLWEGPDGQGIDEVCPADLDGDGIDEVIVGFGGNTGLHAYSSRGAPLWRQTSIGNVWHVAVGDLDGDGRAVVVSSSSGGHLHLFDPADGHPLRTLDLGFYVHTVRTAPARAIPGAKGDPILVAGRDQEKAILTAIGGASKIYWRIELGPAKADCDELTISPDGAWAAVGCQGGAYFVVEAATGKVLAGGSTPDRVTALAWVVPAEGGSPLLVVGSSKSVAAFRLDGSARPAP